MEPLILIVEDDPSLREVTRLGLTGEGYRVVEAADGPSGLAAFEEHGPDLVLLDVMLPGMDGFEVCRQIRRASLVPILMVTARASTVDVVVGLESGADDYIVKPFAFPELVARVRSVLRRSSAVRTALDAEPADAAGADQTAGGGAIGGGTSGGGPAGGGPAGVGVAAEHPEAHVLRVGDLAVDLDAHTVRRGDHEFPLTATEFRLLAELAGHRGAVLTRDQLLERVWGYTFLGDSRLVDVHVQRLRAKIEQDPAQPALILTVRGVGYKAAR